jgi:hypothetical protein
MKKLINRLGDAITKVGERYDIRLLIYNPITWGRFLTSSRHGGRIFSQVVTESYPQVKTCLDVGSGAGGYVYWLNRRGLQAIGVEYSRIGRLFARLQGSLTLPLDCSSAHLCPKLGPFDLVFSIEVAEHITQSLEDRFIEYVASQGRLIIFSAAQPDQPGQGHVNCQPLHYWQQTFARRGFVYAALETDIVRTRLVELGFRGYFPRNCQIFRKSE